MDHKRVYIIIYFLLSLIADRFIYSNDERCDFNGTLDGPNSTWVITPYRYPCIHDECVGVCQPYTGYFPPSNNPTFLIPFSGIKMIMSDDWGCIYYYHDSECKQQSWQDCLGNQYYGVTNITLVKDGIWYPFTRKCYCWLKNVKPCYT